MPDVIVDTNVLAVAEGMHEGASEACRASCIDLLRRVDDGQVVVADESDLVLKQYVDVMSGAGTAGVGVKLAKKLWRQRHGGVVCRLVAITPQEPPPGCYAEVPDDLRNFDKGDLMFIAVAKADHKCSPIYQALDGEWWDRRADFAANGIDVQFLCPVDLL